MPQQSRSGFYRHLPPGQGGCSDCYTTRLNLIIVPSCTASYHIYSRNSAQRYCSISQLNGVLGLEERNAMESANIIHPISHELFTQSVCWQAAMLDTPQHSCIGVYLVTCMGFEPITSTLRGWRLSHFVEQAICQAQSRNSRFLCLALRL